MPFIYVMLILANLILQSRGLPDVEGRKINFTNIKNYIPDFEFEESQDFSIRVWNWRLLHKAGESQLLITNVKA